MAQAELAFNCMPNRSTRVESFIVAYGHLPKNVMDISSVPSMNKKVEDIHEVSKVINKQVEELMQPIFRDRINVGEGEED